MAETVQLPLLVWPEQGEIAVLVARRQELVDRIGRLRPHSFRRIELQARLAEMTRRELELEARLGRLGNRS